jgi:pSer/pThr/pTyr-binding forkhead associated (FHA) protein
MESLPLERNSSRTVHMLIFNENQTKFKMGRGHDSEVRVNDISVSRCHAIINYRPEGIYISDNRSKFGTLVLCKESQIKLLEDTPQIF